MCVCVCVYIYIYVYICIYMYIYVYICIYLYFEFETLGPVCSEGASLIASIGSLLTSKSGDPRETQFLFQRLSIAIQRGNAASVLVALTDSCLGVEALQIQYVYICTYIYIYMYICIYMYIYV